MNLCLSLFFFFNDTATTEIYTLSLHDALPIFNPYRIGNEEFVDGAVAENVGLAEAIQLGADRKSTRLNSSHDQISYAVFCLKKKNFRGMLPSKAFRLAESLRGLELMGELISAR